MRAIEIKSKDVRSHYYVNSGLRGKREKIGNYQYVHWMEGNIYTRFRCNRLYYKSNSYYIQLMLDIVEWTPISYRCNKVKLCPLPYKLLADFSLNFWKPFDDHLLNSALDNTIRKTLNSDACEKMKEQVNVFKIKLLSSLYIYNQ